MLQYTGIPEQLACQEAELLSRELDTWTGLVSCSAQVASCEPDELLIDSGTSLHLVCSRNLGKQQRKCCYPAEAKFATASSVVVSSEAYDLTPSGLLDADGSAIVTPSQLLPDCPNALSPGLLSKCSDLGYWWPPGSWSHPPQLLAGVTRGPEAELAYSLEVRDNVSILTLPAQVSPVASWPADDRHPLMLNTVNNLAAPACFAAAALTAEPFVCQPCNTNAPSGTLLKEESSGTLLKEATNNLDEMHDMIVNSDTYNRCLVAAPTVTAAAPLPPLPPEDPTETSLPDVVCETVCAEEAAVADECEPFTSSSEADVIARLKAEATSLEHLRLHIPKNPFCRTCCSVKAYKKQYRRRGPAVVCWQQQAGKVW